MLQLLQEQTTTADNEYGRLITDTSYDSHGWVTMTSAPYYDSTTLPGTQRFMATAGATPAQTITRYDGQGRVTASQFDSLGTLQWQTSTAHPGADETDVTPPPGGTATSIFTNALGQTTASWKYHGTATPDGNAAHADVTTYTYTPAGQVASVADNNGNTWSFAYNLRGLKSSQADPDAGTTSYGYDANGNLTSTTDARGQTISYTYDALNRKTGEYSGSVAPASELASWSYDTLDKGQLTSSTAYTSGASGPAYVQAVSGYNTSYQPTGTTTTIPAGDGNGNLAGQYTTTNTYTPVTGLLQDTAYSGDGGLPAETVGYGYDLQGLLATMNSSIPKIFYLDDTIYTPEGQVLRPTFGTYGQQLVQTYNYDAGTGRLLQANTDLQTLQSAADTTSYTYNPAGDITSASGAQNTGGTQLQCYTYNNLQELTQAWTDTKGTSTAPGPSVAGIGGCNTTTPSAATIGGPAPYWQSYTYDLLGDRTAQTSHDTSGNISNNVTQTLAYPGSGTTQAANPNQASTVTTTGPGGTTTTTDNYNNIGGTTGRSSSSTGTAPPGGPNQTMSYNALGQTASVTSGGQTSSYTYDASGNLLLQRDPGATILYLDGGAEQLTLTGSNVAGLRYYPAPDGTTIVRSSTGTLSYETTNQQHTALEAIDATSLAITRRYYDPYGNPVGTPPSSWPDPKAFVGRPADPATSLDLLGARQYDPATGRFLSIDPVLQTGDPTQMGGYTYAGNNPVTNADPTGLHVPGCSGNLTGTLTCEGGSGGGGGNHHHTSTGTTTTTTTSSSGGWTPPWSCWSFSCNWNGIKDIVGGIANGIVHPVKQFLLTPVVAILQTVSGNLCPPPMICPNPAAAAAAARMNAYTNARIPLGNPNNLLYKIGYAAGPLVLLGPAGSEGAAAEGADTALAARAAAAAQQLPRSVPEGWAARAADNGAGVVFQRSGAAGNADMIRVMDPTAKYPTGYMRIFNSYGQPVDVFGTPGPPVDTHIPIGYDGPWPWWPGR